MKVNIEDISEEFSDGFLWLSVIEGMDMYRMQLMKSSNSGIGYKALHVYDYDGEELQDEEKLQKLTEKAEEWANGKN